MDKIPLNSFQILALFFPGIFLAFDSIYCYYYFSVKAQTIDLCFKYFKDYGIGFYFAIICYGIIVGLILDSIRNGFLEVIFDRFKKIEWDYFHNGKQDQVIMLYARYYNYYVFDVNMITALFVATIFQLFFIHSNLNSYVIFGMILISFILIKDAYNLRGEIYKITKKK